MKKWSAKARREAATELRLIRKGLDPTDWKHIPSVGPGAMEIRIRDKNKAYRIIYVAKFLNAVAVLHAFIKKTQKTSRKDIDLAKQRYKDIQEHHIEHSQ